MPVAESSGRLSSLSIVLPAYNEAENLDATLKRVTGFVPNVAERFEVIVVNDGSEDATGDILAAWEASCAAVRPQTHAKNRGYGAALVTGFRAARGDFVFFMDSDGQFAIEDLPALTALAGSKRFVTGYRATRRDGPLRSLNAWLYNRAIVRGLFGTRVTDVNCAFKLFPRRLVSDCEPILSRGALINGEMFCKARRAGYEIVETPVRHFPRTAGTQTGANLTVILKMFVEALKLRLKLVTSGEFVPGTTAASILLAAAVTMMTFWGVSRQSDVVPGAEVLKAVGRVVPLSGITEVDRLRHLDAQWYLDIATHGYRIDSGQSNVVFFPLLPMLMRGASELTGMPVPIAGQILVLLFTLTAATLMARYVADLSGVVPEVVDPLSVAIHKALPLIAVLAMMLHPMGVFLHAVYPESLFLTLILGLLLAWRHQRRAWMIGLTFLLALTRPQGLFVPIAFWLHDSYTSWQERRFHVTWTTLGVSAAAATAIGLFAWHLDLTTGAPLSFLDKRSEWDANASWWNIPQLLAPLISRQWLLSKIAIYVTLVGAWLLWRRGERLAALLATCLIVLPLHKGDLGDITRYSLLAVFALVPFVLAIPRVPALIVGGGGVSAYLYGFFLTRWLQKLWVG
jgi:hypothetical protein